LAPFFDATIAPIAQAFFKTTSYGFFEISPSKIVAKNESPDPTVSITFTLKPL